MVGILVQSFEKGGELEATNWLNQLKEQRTTTEEDPGSLGLALALTSLPEFVSIMEEKSLQNSVWSLAEVTVVAWCEELIAAVRSHHITKYERLVQLREEIHRLPEQLLQVEVNQLFPALNDHDAYVRWVAVEVLGKERGGISLDILWNMLHDEDADVRTAVVEAMTARGEEVPVDILLGILREENFGEESKRERVLAAQGERIPLDFLFRMLRNGNIVVQMRAEHVLIAQGGRVPVGQLLELLNSEDADVRAAAIRILGEQGERAPVHRLLDLLHDQDEGVRVAAVRALGKQGERVSRDILLDMLHDPVEWVRAATVSALAIHPEGVPLDILIEMLHDREMSVRRAAMGALGNQEGQRSPQHFLEILKERVEIRGAALQVVGVQGPISVLLSALDDPNIDMRRIAIGLLAKRIEEVPLERLLKLLADEQWSMRKTVVEALGEQVPVERLLELLHDESWIVRAEVVKVLAVRRNRVPVKRLLEMLDDENQQVRATTIMVLGKRGKGMLRKRMGQEKSKFVQVMATVELSGIEQVSIEQLRELLDDKDLSVRMRAIEILQEQGERVPLDIWLSLLCDEEWMLREAAVKALGEWEGHIPVDLLVATVGDEVESVREAALEVLRRRAPDALLPVIDEAMAVLQGQVPGNILGSLVQGYVADVIGTMNQSIPLLNEEVTNLLDWHYWSVRMKAAQALGQIRRSIPDRGIKRLLELRCDPNPEMHAVRKQADDALSEILSLETGIEDD